MAGRIGAGLPTGAKPPTLLPEGYTEISLIQGDLGGATNVSYTGEYLPMSSGPSLRHSSNQVYCGLGLQNSTGQMLRECWLQIKAEMQLSL